MDSELENIELENESGTNSFVFNFDLEGSTTWYKLFDLDQSSCTIQSLTSNNESRVMSLTVHSGDLDVSISSEQTITFNQGSNSFIGSYSIDDNDLTNTITVQTQAEDQISWPEHTETSSDFGTTSAFKCRGDGMILNSSNELESLIITDAEDLDYLHVNQSDSEGLIKWRKNFPFTSIILEVLEIEIDEFGYTYLTGFYQGAVYHEDEIIVEENASSLNNGFIMKLNPLGNLVWAHHIASQQGELEVRSVSVNEEQDILISGLYTGNHDFDFSANTQLVGNFEEENGFLARYTQEPNEAELFLNVPILHSEIEEGGANSLVYVSINREISEDVVVEATPDEQIDLGNGAGQPVELNFTPNGGKIMSLDVTAFDDLAVEGDHTGTITFNSSGEASFANLDEQAVTFDIVDNDPDAVGEQNADSQISVYPNPATDEIKIDYPENLSGKTIDLIRILDVNGSVFLEIKDHPKNQPVSVGKISNGSYLVQVDTGSNEFTTKLLLQ